MAKVIFITGGVVSSLGKGLTSASLATNLQARGFKVKLRKLDPYLNIDPGTMNPNQHGEVFVTNDGAETDLDLGHYERFTGVNATKNDNITAGSVYQNVIKNERKGKYLGNTVQVIPHVTDEIKFRIFNDLKKIDFLIVEVGGTVGDIESLPFLEAIRQLSNEMLKNQTIFIHLTLVPYLKAADELKTKPTQHSVKELRGIGIQPDLLICRCEKRISKKDKEKIALFCNISSKNIIQALDVKSIYDLPLVLNKEHLDERVLFNLGVTKYKKADLKNWEKISLLQKNPKNFVNIGIIGKYIQLKDAYKSLTEALHHSGIYNSTEIKINWISAESSKTMKSSFKNLNGILVPGGFGKRGILGKINSIKFAREHNIPFLGICFGMQLAVIEYAKNVLNIKNASSSEFNNKNAENIIGLMTEWIKDGRNVKRSIHTDYGGSMRLGSYKCVLDKNSLIYKIYGKNSIDERHRHRYEMNVKYEALLNKNGMIISGKSPDKILPEVIEIPKHSWYLGVQFHPELSSQPLKPHPIFNSFLRASLKHKKNI
ncbi:MAG: CTP synthetase [Pelagibacterales bacterium]|nr:CTP synthetase [Pelagibacterales bacterium]OUU61288.1 MAG: CTP synthetase [Alphaproteobacteria bacterium TMED62]